MPEASKYQRLAHLLEAHIRQGLLHPGDKLPGEHLLAREHGISRETVRKAIARLENAGLVARRRGSGTYVCPPPVQAKSVAVITTYIGEYIFPAILEGIEGELSGRGYAPLLMATHNDPQRERRVLLDCLERDIGGLIVEGTQSALPNPNLDIYKRIRRAGLPVVFLNSYYPQLESPVYVAADDQAGGYAAAEHLIGLGHRRIACIYKEDDMQGQLRYRGYRACMAAHGLPLPGEGALAYTTPSRQTLLRSDLPRRLEGFTAAVCYNDEIAVALSDRLRRGGLHIPGDFAIVGFDDSALGDMAAVPITSLAHPKARAGRLAARKLVSLIRGNPEASIVLPLPLVRKGST